MPQALSQAQADMQKANNDREAAMRQANAALEQAKRDAERGINSAIRELESAKNFLNTHFGEFPEHPAFCYDISETLLIGRICQARY